MSLIVNIDEQIAEYEDKGWKDEADGLKKFKELTDLTSYIGDDAENYHSVSSYVELMKDLSKLLSPEIIIESVVGVVQEGWHISFICNGKNENIFLANTDTDWLQPEFIEGLNEILKKHEFNRQLRVVFSKNIYNADQCVDLCFITDEQFTILGEEIPRYA